MLRQCCAEKNIPLTLPVSEETLTKFVLWLSCERKVSHATVSVYLAGIRQLHIQHGVSFPDSRPNILRMLLQGKKNSEIVQKNNTGTGRKPVTPDILKDLKSAITLHDLPLVDKRLLWTVCTALFFGAFRASELLCRDTHSFDPGFALQRKDIICTGNTLQVIVKCPKEEKQGKNTTVTVHAAADTSICPVQAWMKWQALDPPADPEQPAFRWSSGHPLTVQRFNSTLKLLAGEKMPGISSHSFRIGAATTMGELGFSDDDIKAVGRWASPAFERYIRHGKARRNLVAKKFSFLPTNEH